MQDDQVEVSFCDLCGTSVPVADLTVGTAVRHQGKTIGACCLSALRVGAPAVAVGPAFAPRSAQGELRLLPVAVVLLAAIAAATIFLDNRLTSADTAWRSGQGDLVDGQKGQHDVLQAVAVSLDSMARRADLDFATKVGDGLAGVPALRTELQTQLDAVRKELAAVVQLQQAQQERVVDPRPYFDDLRERQQRMTDQLVAAFRAAGTAPPVAEPAPTDSTPAPVPDASAPPAIPPAVADQLKKLTASDPAVRFEGVDALLKTKDPAALAPLLPLARDADSLVRRLTVDGLAQWKRPEVVDVLLAAMGDGDEWVRETAWKSLKDVTGQKLPFEHMAPKDARARAIARWQEWWDKNKATFGS